MEKLGPLFDEARLVILSISVLVGATSGVVRCPSEAHVRWSGTFLLTLGLFLVLLQINSLALEFHHPSPLQGFLNWLKRVRLAINPPAPVTIQAVGTAFGSATASAIGVVTRANTDLATLLADLRREFEERKTADDARHQALVERINRESAAHLARIATLEVASGKLGHRIEALAVGEFFTALTALFLTLVGTIETGLAPEIARLLAGSPSVAQIAS